MDRLGQVLGHHKIYIFVDRDETIRVILLFVFCNNMFLILRKMLKSMLNVVTIFNDTENSNIYMQM